MNKLNGYLFAKLNNIDSKSEGPEYFLQQYDYKEYPVIKQVNLWERDPVLHPLLGEKVVIIGTQQANGIKYSQVVSEQGGIDANDVRRRLQVNLKLEQETFWLAGKDDDGEMPGQTMKLTLSVFWPYRSIWQGECPSTQLHDFWVEFEGRTIWRWSNGQAFAEVLTPVEIPGGSEHEFSELWKINPELITNEGIYTAKTLHIASGEQAEVDFKIRFVQPDQVALAALLKLEIELTNRIDKIATDLSQKHSADSEDQAIERENDEVLIQLQQDAMDELEQIHAAKLRIEQGNYHQCKMCGENIPVNRLLAIPYTKLCITCSNNN